MRNPEQLKAAEKAVSQFADELGLDKEEYLKHLREFWKACPHIEAAMGLIVVLAETDPKLENKKWLLTANSTHPEKR